MKAADQFHVYTRLLLAWRSQWWSAARIHAYQESALVRIMRHATTNVPYYRHLGIDPRSIRGRADLQRFPLLTKRDIQNAGDALLAEGLDRSRLFISRTSGSTGEPTTTYFDRSTWLLGKYVLKMRRMAATGGTGLGQRVLVVSEQPAEALDAAKRSAPSGLGVLFQQRLVSIHRPVDEHLIELQRFRPHVIYAFPSYLLDLVAAAEQQAITLPRVGALYTSSEVLTSGARTRIEQAFGGRLYDIYGSTEMKEVAWQCKHGSYHLNFESTYMETPAHSQRGPLVLTTLVNTGMPLIRFAIGDQATFDSEPCACGRRSPCLSQIDGREGDVITLPSGKRLSPYLLTTVIEADASILQYRIVQTTPSAFRIDVVRRLNMVSQRSDAELCGELLKFAAEANFSVREVDVLERPANGKRSVFVRAGLAA